jgi:predicted transcriptional regulator
MEDIRLTSPHSDSLKGEMPEEYTRPKASGLSKLAISRLGESVAKQLGFDPGGDIFDVVARLGGRVHYQDFWELDQTTTGSVVVKGETNFDIYLPKHTSAERDRFTIAHELGHYVVHFLWPRKQGSQISNLAAARYGSDRTEWEANWFAAAFLMPVNLFSEAAKQAGFNIGAVAERFKVSYAAAEVRARALGAARYVVLKCRPDGKLELGACRDWAVATGRPNTVWRP